MCIASLVLGISSIPLCFLLIPSILAVVFGFVGLGQVKREPQSGRGQAIAGIVLGGAGLVFFALVLLVARADLNVE